MIRDISLYFDDALPSATPQQTNEERRYVHDKNIIAAFKLLRRDSAIRSMQLVFGGRRTLQSKDLHFMKALGRVRADEVEIHNSFVRRLSYTAECTILSKMVRKRKLYRRGPGAE